MEETAYDVYMEEALEYYEESDDLSAAELSFMHGYLDA